MSHFFNASGADNPNAPTHFGRFEEFRRKTNTMSDSPNGSTCGLSKSYPFTWATESLEVSDLFTRKGSMYKWAMQSLPQNFIF